MKKKLSKFEIISLQKAAIVAWTDLKIVVKEGELLEKLSLLLAEGEGGETGGLLACDCDRCCLPPLSFHLHVWPARQCGVAGPAAR